MKRISFLQIAILAALSAPTAAAGQDAFSPTHALAAEELDRNRGGFIVVDGMTIGFGAVVRTFVDGELALQTTLTLGPNGAEVTRTLGTAAAMTDPSEIARVMSSFGLNVRPDQVFVSPDGATAAVHRVDAAQLANLLLNTGDGRTVRQEMDITVALPGFEAQQAGIRAATTAARLNDDVTAAAVAVLGR